jgi:hypothetical protein
MTSRRLTVVLERTLEAKAAQETDALAHEQDDGDDPPAPLLLADRPRRRRRPRRLLVSAAACLAVVALVAGALVLQGDGDEVDDVAVRSLTYGDPPDGWLVPSWVPEGMALWGIDTTSGEREDAEVGGTIPQLLGDPEGGRAIYITSHRYELRPDTVEGVAVRGATGSTGTGWGAAEEELGDAVRWDERGVTLTALYRGTSRDEAIAVLDALEWRSDDPLDGFAPPADDAWPLRAEATSRDTVDRGASLLYSSEEAPGADTPAGLDGLSIYTSSSSTISAGYLETWYLEGDGDGTRPLVTPRHGHELSVHWPDGRSATVMADSTGPPPSLDAMHRIAESVTVADESQVADLRAAIGARVEALPVVATAETGIGTVEVHGNGTLLSLCLRRPGGTPATCGTSTYGGGAYSDGGTLVTADWTVDGRWYVGLASRGETHQILGSGDRSAASDAGLLPAETVVSGDWLFRLVEPGPDIQSVCTGDENAMSCAHTRPE